VEQRGGEHVDDGVVGVVGVGDERAVGLDNPAEAGELEGGGVEEVLGGPGGDVELEGAGAALLPRPGVPIIRVDVGDLTNGVGKDVADGVGDEIILRDLNEKKDICRLREREIRAKILTLYAPTPPFRDWMLSIFILPLFSSNFFSAVTIEKSDRDLKKGSSLARLHCSRRAVCIA
jgi:hypothetical protein